uniref:Uncharacterized protein n=1 Tax=Pavo cristatus TaxID=9049 RepID=A0A8C9ELX9_PAVCR
MAQYNSEGNVESHYSTSDSDRCYACSLCNVSAHLGKPHVKPGHCPGATAASQRVGGPQREGRGNLLPQPGVAFWPEFPHRPLGLPH